MLNSKDRPSGTELMLRSMGLGDVIEAAKRFASAGTTDKIIAFADNIGVYIEQAKRNEQLLFVICDKLGIEPLADPAISGGGTVGANEPGLSQSDGTVGTGCSAVACVDADDTHGSTDKTG